MAEPSFFARICCCSKNDKEPPVTLIRSKEVQNPPQTSISPARETINGFEAQALEVPKEESGPKEVYRGKAPKWKEEKKEGDSGGQCMTDGQEGTKDKMNMNDVMMDDICGEEQEKPCVEDAISIRTNVVEEVDESELKQMSEIVAQPTESSDEPQASSRSGEVVTLEQMLAEGYVTPKSHEEPAPAIKITPAEDGGPRDKEKEETEYKEMMDITEKRDNQEESMAEEDSELEEEVIIHEVPESSPTPPTASPRSILKTTSSTARSIQSDKHMVTKSEEEKDIPPPLPTTPPPPHEILEGLHHAVLVNVDGEPKNPTSMMYADADDSSDSEESDDEAEREVLPPVAKPEDDKTDLEDEEDDENWEKKSEKENDNQITRLSVKSNGQATMTTGNVRLALESVEITDDEFSEKLI